MQHSKKINFYTLYTFTTYLALADLMHLTRAEYVKGVVSPIQIGGQENYEIKI